MSIKETIFAVLLAANLVVTGFLASRQMKPSSTRSQLTDVQVAQLDKIFALSNDFKTELEAVMSRVSFPNDKAKENANTWLQNYRMGFEQARILHVQAKDSRSADDALRYIAYAWTGGGGWSGFPAVVSQVRYPFAAYNNTTENFDPYLNANLSKLDSINTEFRVMALSCARDMK